LSEKKLPTFYRFPYQNYHFRGIPSVDPSKYEQRFIHDKLI
jgi:hypothetical protein